jgi:hypothetical protein
LSDAIVMLGFPNFFDNRLGDEALDSQCLGFALEFLSTLC